MEKPILDKNISIEDFNDFYWLKKELIHFCKENKLQTSGSKLQITAFIQSFLLNGKKITCTKSINKAKSSFDWNTETLTLSTLITDNYKNTENVRAFFLVHIGKNFSFNVLFMKWMKENVGKTLEEAIKQWKILYTSKKAKDYIPEIAPQFEYNKYIQAFLASNPSLSLKDAIRFWKLKKAMRGTNNYEQTDLELK